MITRYGYDNVFIMVGLGIVLLVLAVIVPKIWLAIPLGIAGVLLIAFALWFFRDPDRTIPKQALQDNSIVLSPADGKIVDIKNVTDSIFLGTDGMQVSIFLSPLDVHVNRIPVSGRVDYFNYIPGKYLVAYHPKASLLNEQTHIGVETEYGKLLFKQIVGIVARRLVCELKLGDSVHVGDRFGMMKFGSRMDIIFPPGSEIFVKPGDKVVAGESFLGKLRKGSNS
jgi:phosphatidylserine decarboxylase